MVNTAKDPLRITLYLDDVPKLPDHPDADHDDWSQHYWIGENKLTTFDV